MLLKYSAGQGESGDQVENAVMSVVKKLDSLSAGRMGHSTSEVGDMVVDALGD